MKPFGKPALLGGDIAGGINGALVSLPQSIAYGVIGFAPLGPDYIAYGLIAGIYSSVIVGLVSAVLGGTRAMVSGSRAPTALIFAATVTQVLALSLHEIPEEARISFALTMGFIAVLLSGFFQLLFSKLRIGGLVQFVPYPVIAGFIDASALLILLSQAWGLFGLPRGESLLDLPAALGDARAGPAFLAIATMGVVFLGMRIAPKVPAALTALIGGSLLYYALGYAWPDLDLGGVIGEIPLAYPLPWDMIDPVLQMEEETFWLLWPLVVTAGLSMALLSAFDSLLTAATVDAHLLTKTNNDRELMAQGIGNSLAAIFGCLPASGTVARTNASLAAGARTPVAAVINGVLLAALTLVGAPLLEDMPQSVLVGLLLGVALQSFDNWTIDLVKSIAKGPIRHKRYLLPDIGVISLVVLIAVLSNLIVAVAAGVFMAVVLFILGMSKSLVRRIYAGDKVHSRIQRDVLSMSQLEAHGSQIKVLELEGALFFGSCGQLEKEAERLAHAGATYLIIDMKRVGNVDSSGIATLKRLHARLKQRGVRLALSYMLPERRDLSELLKPELERRSRAEVRWTWVKMRDMGALKQIGTENIFPDTDVALGETENQLLQELERRGKNAGERDRIIPTILLGLSHAELRVVNSMARREYYSAGDDVFLQGDEGDAVYYLLKGEVAVTINLAGSEHKKRVQTIRPGTIFGEMAVLDGNRRSANVVAVEDSVCYRFGLEDVRDLKKEHPELALKLFANLCMTFAQRLRNANKMIMELER